MTVKIMKRLGVTEREALVLLREMLIYCFGYTDVYSDDDSTTAFTAVQSGTDGETDQAYPQIFTSTSAAFTSSHIGLYLTLYDAPSDHIVGVHRIVGVPSGTELQVLGGIYGSSFTTGTSIKWRLIDPSLATAGSAPEFVGQALSGTTPVWQVKFSVQALDSDLIRIQVGPFGGYVDPTWTSGSTAEVQIECDTTPLWYFMIDDDHIKIWTETNAGTAVNEFAYVGAGSTRRAAYDTNFAVCCGGPLLTALADIESIGSDDSTQVSYSVLTFGDSTTNNMFTSLPSSAFDFRNDAADIPVGTDDGSLPEADRGILLGMQWVSDQLSYRNFVDNARQLLCIGSGVAVEWDGTLGK